MQNFKKLFFSTFVLLLFSQVFALNHGGIISSDETWYTVDSPHIVTSYVTVNSGVTLTIEPGCEIRFFHGRFIGIHGTLTAAGTSSNGITFTRNGALDWEGLFFRDGSSGSLIYCTVRYASITTGIGVFAHNTISMLLDHCILENNEIGFYGADCSPQFTNNQFINNNYGIYLVGNCNPVFGTSLTEWNDIYGNGIYDLYNCTSDISSGYVYWGTNDYCEINDYIYDELDNGSLGAVDRIPWVNDSHSVGYFTSAPCTINISIVSDTVYVVWQEVVGSTSYQVYSSDDPYAAEPWDYEAEVTEPNWSDPVSAEIKFYHVKAVN